MLQKKQSGLSFRAKQRNDPYNRTKRPTQQEIHRPRRSTC